MSMEDQLARKLVNNPHDFDLAAIREVASKFTGRETRLVDEGDILESLKQMFIEASRVQ
jgi:hypothetical protein